MASPIAKDTVILSAKHRASGIGHCSVACAPTDTIRPRFRTRSKALARVAGAPTASTTTSAPSPSVSLSIRARASRGSAASAPFARAKRLRISSGSMTTTALAPQAWATRLASCPTAPPPMIATLSPGSRRARSNAAHPVARLSRRNLVYEPSAGHGGVLKDKAARPRLRLPHARRIGARCSGNVLAESLQRIPLQGPHGGGRLHELDDHPVMKPLRRAENPSRSVADPHRPQ